MKKIVFVWFLILCSCSGQYPKINGISFVGSREKIVQLHVDPLLNIHANYAAVMPFGFLRDLHSPELIFDADRQWYGETKKGARQYIELLHKNRVKIMLKPQIWIWKGEFTGDMTMKSEEDWLTFEKSYTDFILTYADLAQQTHCEIYCIGTELEEFVKHRPNFWPALIKKVKAVYNGKLTYAANWDEYTRTPFWEELDYVGVDAYFPLCENRYPSKETLKLGWKPWKEKLKALSKEKKKPILFTEFGYRSMDYTGKKPWLVDRNQMNVNLNAQANATQVIFDEFWNEDWFAGGFVWKWFIHHDKVGGENDNRFTPQNKPAELVIRDHYAKVSGF
ncbi:MULTISPECIES: glycoside hydrolase family 113 [Flavobacteriaceae]|uniref:glycoside hydrolase family 113 n=1 Tax=Flavobacteriaceae TaxID=49546 RepID=UPI0014914B3A|nr:MULTISPECIES: glycoside hydrolase [Allomuricauda]MDC6365545.1 glycoside hydrolase [Muricauda sp. AC10]